VSGRRGAELAICVGKLGQHYHYDPAKSEAYAATTLSWLADPAGEHVARLVLERLESSIDGPPRPRRAASARIDLSLALLAADKPDEAAGVALHAVTSGRLVPSNYWRAREVVHAVAEAGPAEAARLTACDRSRADRRRKPAMNRASRHRMPGRRRLHGPVRPVAAAVGRMVRALTATATCSSWRRRVLRNVVNLRP
jgi:hypothetical protein